VIELIKKLHEEDEEPPNFSRTIHNPEGFSKILALCLPLQAQSESASTITQNIEPTRDTIKLNLLAMFTIGAM